MMAKTDYLQIRIDPALKAESKEVFQSMGLTASDAINLFLVKVVNEKCIPFQMSAPSTSGK